MASRTRDRLIEVARQLFMRQGLENTTMNDIATASDRGRRTLYTYFSTKSDIYQAVIEKETAKIKQELEQTVAAADTPPEKLRALIDKRLALVSDNSRGYQVWLKALLNRDAKRAAAVRNQVAERIYEMIKEIVADGVASGDFVEAQTMRLPAMLTMLVRGNDWTMAHMDDDEGQTAQPERTEQWRRQCVDFIINAITKH